ncbi:MAG: alginate export family protein [Lutibacter sp.]|jgi:hypothetical protein|nr:alginate export family protein [Lutibacter sp.]
MKKHFISILFLLFFTLGASAQYVNLSAELRPRLENRQGYKSLLAEDQEAASFVSQRTRLNLAFTQENLHMGVSLQNVRVWGDVSTLAASDKATAFHEAWAEAILSPALSLKFGRQEIVYDDSRIFGNVGWAQQGRSHDAMLAKFTLDSNRTLHLGFAMNADAQTNTKVAYSNAAGYKNFQYAWYHHKLGRLGMSLLFLNNGVNYDNDGQQAVDYSRTFGGRLYYKIGNITTDFSSYYQGGQLAGNTMNARYFSGNLTFRPRAGVSLKLGTEYLSGKDMNDTSSEVKSFVPLYGTNHKFNGWMDYFFCRKPRWFCWAA